MVKCQEVVKDIDNSPTFKDIEFTMVHLCSRMCRQMTESINIGLLVFFFKCLSDNAEVLYYSETVAKLNYSLSQSGVFYLNHNLNQNRKSSSVKVKSQFYINIVFYFQSLFK